jgi:hypothetical protein
MRFGMLCTAAHAASPIDFSLNFSLDYLLDFPIEFSLGDNYPDIIFLI